MPDARSPAWEHLVFKHHATDVRYAVLLARQSGEVVIIIISSWDMLVQSSIYEENDRRQLSAHTGWYG
jgi:hypothetical protein